MSVEEKWTGGISKCGGVQGSQSHTRGQRAERSSERVLLLTSLPGSIAGRQHRVFASAQLGSGAPLFSTMVTFDIT